MQYKSVYEVCTQVATRCVIKKKSGEQEKILMKYLIVKILDKKFIFTKSPERYSFRAGKHLFVRWLQETRGVATLS